MFVLAASTVEYASNPIASYPVSATSSRSLEDSVINEAVLFTLSPFPIPGTNTESAEWRASAAHRIFMDNAEPSLPAGSLALAMLALVGNRVLWVDGPMVRRHCAPASGDIFGLGLVDESRRIAHFEQFEGVIGPVIAGSTASALPAASLVRALPAMGRLPTGSVALRAGAGEPERLSQNWLPAAVPAELVALPEDEIEALLRESVQMPPIDLGASEAVLKNTPVSIIVPVPREDWAGTPAEVAEAALPLVPPPAVGGAPTDSAAILDALLNGTPAPTAGDTMLTAAWRTLLGRTPFLWYARRRQFQRSDDPVSGVLVTLPATGGAPSKPSEVVIVRPGEVTRPSDVIVPVTERGGLSAREAAAAADAMAEPLKALAEAYGAERLFAAVDALDAPLRLQVLALQTRLLAAGSDTAALSVGAAAARDAGEAEALLRRLTPEMAMAYAAAEPAIIGTDLRLTLRVPTGGDTAPAAKLMTGLVRITDAQAQAALRASDGVTVDATRLAEADVLAETLATIVGERIDGTLSTLTPASEETRKARMRMVGSGIVPELAAALPRIDASNRARLLPLLRRAFAGTSDDARMATAMRTALRRFP